ncbi:hypothetical protein V6N12_028266 [Hibiscus sabdariffa]|uniref:Reverse transcriptase zinc-binding domain-containing protein n=1 Tax=Hibiscus sabdariffa TaxID=183260 RepID=A0ABR2F5B6_9ROSI
MQCWDGHDGVGHLATCSVQGVPGVLFSNKEFVQSEFLPNIAWSICNENSIDFLNDIWVPSLGPLRDHIEDPSPFTGGLSLKDFVSMNGTWDCGALHDLFPSSVVDRILSIKCLEQCDVDDSCILFLWIAYQRKLLTNTERYRRNMSTSSLCVGCSGVVVETTVHVLRDCREIRHLWGQLIPMALEQPFFSMNLQAWLSCKLTSVETTLPLAMCLYLMRRCLGIALPGLTITTVVPRLGNHCLSSPMKYRRHGPHRLRVGSASLLMVVVDLVNSDSVGSSVLSLVRGVARLRQKCWLTDVMWIPRDKNKVVDALTRLANPFILSFCIYTDPLQRHSQIQEPNPKPHKKKKTKKKKPKPKPKSHQSPRDCQSMLQPIFASVPERIMDDSGLEFVVIDKGKCTYSGYLILLEDWIPVTFLPFKTMKETWDMFVRLTESPEPKVRLSQPFLSYEDELLIAVEPFETIESYFTKKMNDWKSNASQGNIVADKANWFKYIEEDFTKFFRDAIRLCCDGTDDRRYDYIYNNLEQCLVITTAVGCVKFLPVVDGNKNENNDADFEKLQKFMSRIIGLPFDMKDVVGDPDFNIPRELASFLYHLSNDNLNYMGPKFLLGAPFTWSVAEKYRFISILDLLIKSSVILEDKLRTQLELNQELDNWKSFLVGYPVLFKICDYPRLSGGQIESYSSVVDIVRFCDNVYWDYNGATTRYLDRVGIERELSSAIPNLYVSLFEGLISYARSLLEREPIFDKLITSKELW